MRTACWDGDRYDADDSTCVGVGTGRRKREVLEALGLLEEAAVELESVRSMEGRALLERTQQEREQLEAQGFLSLPPVPFPPAMGKE